MKTQKYSVASAFTLIELLTVIAIIGILAAIIIPTVGKVRQSAKRAQSTSNLKGIAQGIHLYMADHKQRLPQLKDSGVDTGFWTLKLEDYVGKRVKTQVKPSETANISPLFLDPLCPLHHGISDYGANDYFMKQGQDAPFSDIQNPSQVILLAWVRETDPNQGSWRIYTAGAVSSGYENETMRLTDRGLGGGYLVAYADGHTAMLGKVVYSDQATRRKLLREQ